MTELGNPTRTAGRFRECFAGGRFAHAMKPRRIEINTKTGRSQEVLENAADGSPDSRVEQLKRA